MRKAAAFTFIFFMLLSNMMGQPDSLEEKLWSKIVVSGSGSWVIPMGKFSEYGGTGMAGIPISGIGGKVEVDYFSEKYFGFECTYAKSVNETTAPTQKQLFPNYGGGGLGGGSVLTSYSYNSKKWTTNNILLGIIFKMEDGWISVRYKLSAGLQQIKSPETRVDGTGYGWQMGQPNKYYTFTNIQPKMISNTLVLAVGIDLNVRIIGRFGLIIGCDLLNSYGHFDVKGTSDTNYGGAYPNQHWEIPASYNPQIKILFLSAGISCSLN